MSIAILSTSHHVTIGYILAKIDNRNRFLYETIERAKKASLLNVQSYNARYNTRVKREKIAIGDYANVDFYGISIAQQAKCVDAYLYNCDNAKGFDKSEIVKKLRAYRDSLEYDESDYDSCQWFIESLPMIQPKSIEQFKDEYARIHCVSAKW